MREECSNIARQSSSFMFLLPMFIGWRFLTRGTILTSRDLYQNDKIIVVFVSLSHSYVHRVESDAEGTLMRTNTRGLPG